MLDASENKLYKFISTTTINHIKKTLKDNKNVDFMLVMKHIFYDNRNEETCLLYSLINNKLLRQLEKKYDNFSRLEQLEYYLII